MMDDDGMEKLDGARLIISTTRLNLANKVSAANNLILHNDFDSVLGVLDAGSAAQLH